jgi:FKBP-type peptidyl-prolyl cis-trans isomerase FkpA
MWINKKALFGILGVLVIGLLGGGYVFLTNNNHKSVNFGAGSNNVLAATTQTQSGSNSVPLNQNSTSQTDTSGGLSVNSSSPTDGLGQQGQSQSSGSSGSGSSSSSSSQSNPFDPSTFAQYDQYKDPKYTTALFGDVQVGTGAAIATNQKAVVYYKGWLTNGQLFDESKTDSSGNLQPFSFTLGAHQVITGWEQGVLGMKVGGTRLLVIPPSVGYGTTGQGPIPANAVLVFEVQLIAIQ